MAPPRKKASTKRSARSGPAEPAGPSIAGGRAPSTLTASEVLDYAGSERAREILARSVAFRRSLRPQDIEVIGASSLFRAALAIGRGPPPTVPSAAHWLAEWLARSASTEKIDHWLNTVRVDDPASLDLPLTNSAAAALGRAVTLARLTLERDQFETRHLVAALLLPAGEQMSAAIKEDLDQFGAPAESFLKELVSRIQSNPDAMERLHLDVWEAVAKGEFKDPRRN